MLCMRVLRPPKIVSHEGDGLLRSFRSSTFKSQLRRGFGSKYRSMATWALTAALLRSMSAGDLADAVHLSAWALRKLA